MIYFYIGKVRIEIRKVKGSRRYNKKFLFFIFLIFTDSLSSVQYYYVYCSLYLFIYWYGVNNSFKYKTLLGYAMLALFEYCMVVDAYFYPKTETIIYEAYEYFITGIHLCIIATLFEWTHIRESMGNLVDSITRFLGYGYNFSFV